MRESQILDGIRTVLRDKLGVSRPVEPDTQLFADLELDSMQQLTLVVEIENRFRICFEPGEETGITSVADVVDAVSRAVARQADHVPG